MLHPQQSSPPRIGPARSLSSLSPEQSYPALVSGDRTEVVQRIPLHAELVIQRKEALRADLKRVCAEQGISRAQFADNLTGLSGERVTERTIERWLDTRPEGLRRRMSAEMGVYWSALTGCTFHFDELLDEIKHATVPTPHKIIAASYIAKIAAEQSLAQAMRRAS